MKYVHTENLLQALTLTAMLLVTLQATHQIHWAWWKVAAPMLVALLF